MKTSTRTDIRLILCDRHPHVRIGLRSIFAADPAIKIVAEAGDAKSLPWLIESLCPDVVVLEAPRQASLASTVSLSATMAVVVIVGDDLAVEDWISLVSDGIAGVVQRDSPAEELVNAVRAAAAGDGYISPALSGGLLQLIRTRLPQPRVPLKPRPALTVRESEVFELLCQGKANKEIASILGLGEKTVKFHVSNVLAKSQVRTRGQLIASSRSAVPEFA